jgi:aspartyl aminopeptidase
MNKIFTRIGFISLIGLSLTNPLAAIAEDKEPEKSSWLAYSAQELKQVESYATDYKVFMHKARTELSFVEETVKLAEAEGFKPLKSDSVLKPGARFYDVNRARAMNLIVIGKKDLSQGLRIVGSHIDSPRIELKGRPLFEKEGFALFQTYIHGGIKNYQWVNIPLALVGHVDKKDGTRVKISVGLHADDPVLMVPDLSPHVDREYRKRTNREVIKKEELDVLVASKPGKDSKVKDQVIAFLKAEYNIELADLVSAELVLVPAMKPRDVGLDRSMIAAYGQDDKLSAYASVRAILQQDVPEYTSMAYLVDNEEVGNINNTGAKSTYLVDLIAEMIYLNKGDKYNDHFLRKTLRQTKVVSTDVNPGVNPNWPGVWDLGNAPRLGNGVNIKLYGGGFNANSEYIAWTRKYLDESNILWQTTTYKGKASGGTIGSSLSKDNMEVIDFGVPVLSIHSPYAVSSKVDIYSLYRAMSAFYQHK